MIPTNPKTLAAWLRRPPSFAEHVAAQRRHVQGTARRPARPTRLAEQVKPATAGPLRKLELIEFVVLCDK